MAIFRRKLADADPGGNHLFGHIYGADRKHGRRQDCGRDQEDPQRDHLGQADKVKPLDLAALLGKLDLTEVFKTKGDLKRWSAKRTIGGLIAVTACNDIVFNGITWPAVALCLVAITPLCLSFMEQERE